MDEADGVAVAVDVGERVKLGVQVADAVVAWLAEDDKESVWL